MRLASQRKTRVVKKDRMASEKSQARYLSLHDLSAYASLSVRTLRSYLRHGEHPLPHFRLPGKIVVNLDDFHAWMENFRHHKATTEVSALVDKLFREL